MKDLNNSQDPKHALFCRENAFVVIYVFFSSDNKCPLFTCLGGGGSPKADIVCFLPFFLYDGFPNYLVTNAMILDLEKKSKNILVKIGNPIQKDFPLQTVRVSSIELEYTYYVTGYYIKGNVLK